MFTAYVEYFEEKWRHHLLRIFEFHNEILNSLLAELPPRPLLERLAKELRRRLVGLLLIFLIFL